jgi:hypothetical protein
MITLPNNVEVHFFAGAKTMSGTLDNTALADAGLGWERHAVTVAITGHGLKADTEVLISSLNNAAYKTNQMRYIYAVDTNEIDASLGKSEAFTAATPAGTETWGAGFASDDPYFLLGFKLHLNAADASGEALTLTTDSKRGTYWDTVLFKHPVMTGVTDLIWFPDIKIPLMGGDLLKFAWTNTGAKTWGVELHVQKRV